MYAREHALLGKVTGSCCLLPPWWLASAPVDIWPGADAVVWCCAALQVIRVLHNPDKVSGQQSQATQIGRAVSCEPHKVGGASVRSLMEGGGHQFDAWYGVRCGTGKGVVLSAVVGLLARLSYEVAVLCCVSGWWAYGWWTMDNRRAASVDRDILGGAA